MASQTTDRAGATRAQAPPVLTPADRGVSPYRRTEPVPPAQVRRGNFLLELYRSALGKKYVMAITGIVGLGYVLAHMIGNLKLYMGASSINEYGEFLRELGEPIFPRTVVLWGFRFVLIAAVVLHIHAAWSLTRMNRRARLGGYKSRRDYVAASFASRTMRWTGVLVALFIVYHLADLTWGVTNPDFVRGDVYGNIVASFSVWPVALFYIAANLALGLHLYHGAWSMFQSLGINSRRFNPWRRTFAVAFAAVIVIGNVSFPVAVLTGVVS